MHRGKKSQKTEIYLCKPVMIDQPREITAQQSEHARIQWLAVCLPPHPMVGSFLTNASNGWLFSYHCIQWLAVFLPMHPMVGSFLTTASNGWQFSYHYIQWLIVFLPLHPMVGSFLTTATRWFNPSQYSPTFETWIYLQTCMFRAYKNVASICFADSVLQNLVISYLKFLF